MTCWLSSCYHLKEWRLPCSQTMQTAEVEKRDMISLLFWSIWIYLFEIFTHFLYYSLTRSLVDTLPFRRFGQLFRFQPSSFMMKDMPTELEWPQIFATSWKMNPRMFAPGTEIFHRKFRFWTQQMEVWKMIFKFNWVIFRFHINFEGCRCQSCLGSQHSLLMASFWSGRLWAGLSYFFLHSFSTYCAGPPINLFNALGIIVPTLFNPRSIKWSYSSGRWSIIWSVYESMNHGPIFHTSHWSTFLDAHTE